MEAMQGDRIKKVYAQSYLHFIFLDSLTDHDDIDYNDIEIRRLSVFLRICYRS